MLTPNTTYKINGVTVNEKIIPDGTRWKNGTKAKKAGFNGAGDLYKKNQKIAGGPKSVTIHNTGDLKNVYDDGEQYTRATYNENMRSARVHFYVDDTGAWQDLKAGTGLCPNDPEGSAEVSWHSGDGSVSDGGNMTSVSMEIIMGESTEHDTKAKDNGARIAAWLLWKHGLPISKLVTHTYWVNKSAGKSFADVDEQCTNEIRGKKWCPSYIFGSHVHAIALGNWKTFKALVKKYLDALKAPVEEKPVVTPPAKILYYVQTGAYRVKANADSQLAKVKAAGFDAIMKKSSSDLYRVQIGAYSVKANATEMEKKLKAAGFSTYVTTVGGTVVTGSTQTAIKVGDKVRCKPGVTQYSSGVKMPSWVRVATLYVRQIEKGGKVYLVSTKPVKKEYTGRVWATDVQKI